MWYLDIFGRAWKLWGIQPPQLWPSPGVSSSSLGRLVMAAAKFGPKGTDGSAKKNLKKMIVWGLLRFLLFRAISEGSNPTNLSMFTMFIRIARRNNLYCSFDSFQSVGERWRFQLSTVWNLTPAIARSHHGWRIACRKQNAAEGADNN